MIILIILLKNMKFRLLLFKTNLCIYVEKGVIVFEI